MLPIVREKVWDPSVTYLSKVRLASYISPPIGLFEPQHSFIFRVKHRNHPVCPVQTSLPVELLFKGGKFFLVLLYSLSCCGSFRWGFMQKDQPQTAIFLLRWQLCKTTFDWGQHIVLCFDKGIQGFQMLDCCASLYHLYSWVASQQDFKNIGIPCQKIFSWAALVPNNFE